MIRFIAARLIPYRSFGKFLALHGCGILLLIYVASRFTNVEVQGSPMPISQLFAGAETWRTVAALARWLFYVPAFFTVQLVCAEMELKLVRAQIIAGLEHHEVVAAWTIQSVMLSLFGVVVAVLAGLMVGTPGSAPGFGLPVLASSELGLALYGLCFLSIAVLAGVTMRRPVPALVLLILWPMVGEPLAGYLLEKAGLPAGRDYLPFSALATLVPWPGGPVKVDFLLPATLCGLGYGALASVATWARLKTMDL